ncbi:MAG: hypothetical protein ACK5Y6_03535 [Pseudomonadota bacterium]|jgi:hypothetical protein
MEQSGYSTSQSSTQSGPLREHEELGQTAGQYLDKALHLIGAKMRSAATAVRERAPKEGSTKGAIESASQMLDSTGQYMMRERVRDQARADLGAVISRHPLRSLGVFFLVGLVAGNVLRGGARR